MEYAIGYVAIVFALQAIAAIRTPYENTQTVFVATVFWPLMIVLVVCSFILDAIKVGFDVNKGIKMFGFRKPTNTQVRGFAISIFYVEFQFWKVFSKN